MQDKEKFIFPGLDETQTGRDTQEGSWKDQQDTQTGSAGLHLSGKTCCARAVPAWGCHSTEVPGVIT